MATKSTAAGVRAVAEPGMLVWFCVAAWAIPGAGHMLLGRRQKAIIFFAALLGMFGLGLALQGRIFPFTLSEPLVALAAVANFGLGLPWMVTRLLGAGGGTVTAASYEYGNCFLIVAGLLNFLIILDAFDIGMGRK